VHDQDVCRSPSNEAVAEMGEYDRRVDTADRALTAALDEVAAWRRD
jgi:hypothetical protein